MKFTASTFPKNPRAPVIKWISFNQNEEKLYLQIDLEIL